MATKKPKKGYQPGDDIPIATDAKAFRNSKFPKVLKGTHLTVYTNADGSTKLEWDDNALLQEVRAAIASVETKPKKVAPKKAKVEELKTKRKTKETK